MNLNLKMPVEGSKRRSHFLSLVFITKCNKHVKRLLFSFKSKDRIAKLVLVVRIMTRASESKVVEALQGDYNSSIQDNL